MTTAKKVVKKAAKKVTKHRAPDQDTAIEQAFVAGVLPEEDRRHPEVPEEVIPVSGPVYEWIARGDGTVLLYTDGQIEPDHEVIAIQRAIRVATA